MFRKCMEEFVRYVDWSLQKFRLSICPLDAEKSAYLVVDTFWYLKVNKLLAQSNRIEDLKHLSQVWQSLSTNPL